MLDRNRFNPRNVHVSATDVDIDELVSADRRARAGITAEVQYQTAPLAPSTLPTVFQRETESPAWNCL